MIRTIVMNYVSAILLYSCKYDERSFYMKMETKNDLVGMVNIGIRLKMALNAI